MTYVLLLLLINGKVAVLDVASKERCEFMLSTLNEGTGTIELRNGIPLAIAPGGQHVCMPKAEFEAKQGAGT